MKLKIAILCLALIPVGMFGCGQKRIVDNINLPFVNDPTVIGEWYSMDFVKDPSIFTPDSTNYDKALYLKGLSFQPKGKIIFNTAESVNTATPWITWTKGVVMHNGDKTASAYTIQNISGVTYMFLEWKTGDYYIRHEKPYYYVLEKK